MREMLSKWPSRHVLALVFLTGTLGGTAVVGLVAVVLALVTHHQRESQRVELEASLKQEMINRGMSAAEIDQVIRATATPDTHGRDDVFWRTQLVKDLKKQGMKTDEIERVVRAISPASAAATGTATAAVGRQMPVLP